MKIAPRLALQLRHHITVTLSSTSNHHYQSTLAWPWLICLLSTDRTTEQNDLSSCCEAAGVLCGPTTHCFGSAADITLFPRLPLHVDFLLGPNLRPWRSRRYIPPYTSVDIHRTTRPYIPEHINHHSHRHENSKSNITLLMKPRGSVVGWGTMLQAGRSRVRVPMRWNFSSFQPH
jgi:hypothetical protein